LKRIATIGFFDGVHKGHQYLFSQLRSQAESKGLEALVVTFDRHPRSLLDADYVPQLLTTREERIALLEQEAAHVLVLDFSEIRSMTAAEFMIYLRDRADVSVLMMGYDHRFGSDRLTRPQDYRRTGAACGICVQTIGEYAEGEWHVSSTEIRQALEKGNIAVANELLGRPYSLSGEVVHGNGIGRTIGFPTANIAPENNEKITPKNGVYLVKAYGEGIESDGILNIGTNPTVGNKTRSIELHLPSFTGDLYGKRLTIGFQRYLREEKRFDGLQELQLQIAQDVASIRH